MSTPNYHFITPRPFLWPGILPSGIPMSGGRGWIRPLVLETGFPDWTVTLSYIDFDIYFGGIQTATPTTLVDNLISNFHHQRPSITEWIVMPTAFDIVPRMDIWHSISNIPQHRRRIWKLKNKLLQQKPCLLKQINASTPHYVNKRTTSTTNYFDSEANSSTKYSPQPSPFPNIGTIIANSHA